MVFSVTYYLHTQSYNCLLWALLLTYSVGHWFLWGIVSSVYSKFQNWSRDAKVIRVKVMIPFSLSDHIDPPNCDITIELRMVSIFLAHSLASSQHTSFLCLFFSTSLAIYHSNVGVQLRRVFHGYCDMQYMLEEVG